MGWRLASKLGVRPGDELTLISSKANLTAFGSMPKMKSYTVLGTFNSGMSEYDSNMAFLPLKEAQKLFGVKGISQMEIFVQDVSQTGAILDVAFDKISDEVRLYDWRHTNQAFFNAVEVERNVMFLILTLIIIVAAFNMISGLIMLVQDKGKDIAVLRTFGVSRRSMMKIFILSGTSIGIIGATLGTVLGVIVAIYIEPIRKFFQWATGRDLFPAELYYLSELPSRVEFTTVLGIAVLAIALAFLATIYPAWKAANTDPVEVLRNE